MSFSGLNLRVLRGRPVIRFIIVGAIGFVVQIAALVLLMTVARWRWLPATVVAVELAVVHNFLWHERWTWSDGSRFHQSRTGRFVLFNLTTGLTSIVGNAALMTLFAALIGLPAIAGNVLAVFALSALNFIVADRWTFQSVNDVSLRRMRPARFTAEVLHEKRRAREQASRRVLVAAVVAACASGASVQAAPAPAAVAAWNQYVAETEGRIERERVSTLAAIESEPGDGHSGSRTEAMVSACSAQSGPMICAGESINVPSATISRWRGSVFLRGISLDRLLHALQHPGTPPPQEEIASSRVLSHTADSLRVSIRLVRTTIVTMTYDTEHEMRLERWGPVFATARSVATRIDEVGGDHGFLWRLNSYWRYLQVKDGVLVELESLSLSRVVPVLVRPVAAPIVTRIAHESMLRTLEALRRYVLAS